jgi:hypothetical protein
MNPESEIELNDTGYSTHNHNGEIELKQGNHIKKHDKGQKEKENFASSGNSRPPPTVPAAGNLGLKLLDACFDDVAYARYLLQSKLPSDRQIRSKVNWKDPYTGVSILHCLAYSDLETALKLLIDHNADVNIRNKVT